MSIEIDTYGNRNEYADENNWLYQDRGENDRYFTGVVYLGKDEPAWLECTDAEKIAWEEEHHPKQEPEEPQE